MFVRLSFRVQSYRQNIPGIQITGIPAFLAASIPFKASSKTRQFSDGGLPSFLRASRKRSGAGFPFTIPASSPHVMDWNDLNSSE